MTELSLALEEVPILAILRGVRPEGVEAIAGVLVAAGVRAIEVPMNSPEAIDSVRKLADRWGEIALVGAGTVTTVEQVDAIADAGGRLIVSPHCNPRIIGRAVGRGLIPVPGVFTPTEAFQALEAGAAALKLFPAAVAGPSGLKAIKTVLPEGTAVLAVGGVTAEALPEWWAAGADGYGIGSGIYRPGDRPWTTAQRAAPYLRTLKQLKAGSR